MNGLLILFIITLVAYIILAGQLFYIWWKYGRGDGAVRTTATIFISGSILIFIYFLNV